jgi:hypothetical protein
MLKLKNKKIPLIILAALVLAGSGLYLLAQHRQKDKNVSPGSSINLKPGTKADQDKADQDKNRLVNNDNQSSSNQTNNSKKAVSPTITYADINGGQLEISAFVGGIFEDGGLCSYKVSFGSTDLTKQSTGVANVSTVSCPGVSFSKDDIEASQVSVVVTYSSATAEGSSVAKTVSVQ